MATAGGARTKSSSNRVKSKPSSRSSRASSRSSRASSRSSRASSGSSRASSGSSRASSGSSRASSRSNQASSRSSNGSSSKQRPESAAHRQRQAPDAPRPTPDGKAAALREDVQHSAREAGQVLSKVAKKAKTYGKTPILIGGTALAGAAGGLALGARRNRPRKVLGVEVPRNGVHVKSRDIARTARQVGKFTETAGHIAAELRRANEESNGKTRLSPIEVVLRGLTTRR